MRSKYPDIPISLLLCANLIYAQTLDGFYQRCAEVGVDAVLVADIPLLASEPYIQSAQKYDIQQFLSVHPMQMKQPLKQWRKKQRLHLFSFSSRRNKC